MRGIKILALSYAAAVMAICGWASAGIEGSKHDFSNEAWSADDRCGACHAPHRDTPPKAAPLWDPEADLTRTFGAFAASKATPGRGTLLCLRCHDGTIAKDARPGARPDRFTHKQHPGLFRASHGTSNHPVGVEYPQFDDKFHPAASVIAKGTVTLPDGKVECVSCHDPHNTSGEEKMLVTSNAGSALCLTCHKK